MQLGAKQRLACISNSSTALSTASSLCRKHGHVIKGLVNSSPVMDEQKSVMLINMED